MSRAPRPNKSKTQIVRCRVKTCKEDLILQNYQRHLEKFHPGEDSKDLRGFGVFKISFSKQASCNGGGEKQLQEIEDVNANSVTNVECEEASETKAEQVQRGSKRTRVEEAEDTEEKSDFQKISQKLDTLIQQVQEMKVAETGAVTDKEERKAPDPYEDGKEILKRCKSVTEIEAKVPEFEYKEDPERVTCSLCSTSFQYDKTTERGKGISPQLSHLKGTLKAHLDSVSHRTALATSLAEEQLSIKTESRNKVCGMNLARTSFYLLSNGLPTSHFTSLISMQHRNGCDLGDINHSFNFVKKMATSCSEVIQERLKKHLSTRLPQTGCLPPCKIVQDGATYKHNTRHLTGLTTIFPGDEPLLQSVFLSAPIGIKSDGRSTAASMVSVVSPFMKAEQYLGTSQDGANFLAHVGELVDELLKVKGFHDWDGVHAAATVETGLRNPKKPWAKIFAWLLPFNNIISKANRFHNWGMMHERFFQTLKAMVEDGFDFKYKTPKFFSETRFANYAIKIYEEFR